MTAEGHLLFSIACAVFAKNAELTPVLAQGDWWHIVPSAILTCFTLRFLKAGSFRLMRYKEWCWVI
ncbi:inner membrane protein [Klebsiella pneumoniae]|uniref:Inner membrane protein n=1 Tax=Klebsiella pneumoniae TaxID=573 RepID=A0A8B4VR60_KLEPN|nr:inner membrane protein [Klebsiella pneumoniae]